MRIRSIKPEFWRDATTGEMPPDLALFYLGLSCFADDAGRFEWEPRLLRADLDPFDVKFGGVEGITALLTRLVEAGRIRPYTADGRAFGEIPTFTRHQHPKKASFRCPAPIPGGYGTSSPPVPNRYGTGTEPVPAGGGGGRGGGGGGGGGGENASVPLAPSPVVAVLPCSGEGPSEYGVTQSEVDRWALAYPEANVLGEVLKAQAWLEDHPAKRKRHSGIRRFLVNWMARASEDASKRATNAPGTTQRPAAIPAAPHSAFGAGEGARDVPF